MAAGDKHQRTEKATPKRRKEARDRGQVPRSADVSAFIGLLGASALLPALVSSAKSHILGVFQQSLNVIQDPTTAGAEGVFGLGMKTAFEVILPLAAALAAVGVAANAAQVGLHLTPKALRPKFSRISPKGGFSRLFSPMNAVNLWKQVAKIVILGGITTEVIMSLMHSVPAGTAVPLISTVGIGAGKLLTFVRTVALIGVALGILDYAYQRKHLFDSLKMTKQEVKYEMRYREGDPYTKGEIRKRSYQIARTRVLAAVRTADVVVANPTHFAVALQYDKARAAAPVVLAKGEGLLALRIKDEAGRCLIPVVEDPPLARYLFATTEPGHVVPTEIYVAVARLLAFIYSLPPSLRGGNINSYPHSAVPFDPADELDEESQLAGTAARGGL